VTSTPALSALTPTGHDVVRRCDPSLPSSYATEQFLQLDRFVSATWLAAIVERLLPSVRPLATRIVEPPEISPGSLQGGRRFGRIDTGPFEANRSTPQEAAAIGHAFRRSGLDTFVDTLLDEITPFVEFVTSRSLHYDRTFLLHYQEGDFVGPHGDTQTSRRIMLQLPVTFGCRTAYRVLRGDWMEVVYDEPGSLRIVGPGVWHEVVPVLAADPSVPAERVVVTIRLPYSPTDPA
jgi:hypothetical protein